MRKAATLIMCMIMVFGMASCNSSVDVSETSSLESNETSSSESSEAENATSTASPSIEFTEGTLSAQAQLVLGTFNLEGTDLAVDSEQAAVLLPLWRAYSNLLQSDTAAEAEVDAIFEQIQGSMTQDQMELIAAMEMTQGDMASLVEELGLQIENPRPDDGTGEGSEGRPFDGQPPEGAQAEGDPGGQGFGQEPNPEQMATRQVDQAEMGGAGARGGDRMTLLLIDPLIELLESKTA